MKIQYCFSAILCMLAYSCSSPSQSLTGPGEMRQDFAITDQIKYKINCQLSKEGFQTWGTGGAYYPTIRLVSDSYATDKYRYTSINDVRLLICRVVEMYLTDLNNEKRIRPFLYNFPLTAKNIELSFNFFDKYPDELSAPYIASVHCSNGLLTYYSNNEMGKSVAVLKESFEQAYEIYQQNSKESHVQ